jgi:hypothetical protein
MLFQFVACWKLVSLVEYWSKESNITLFYGFFKYLKVITLQISYYSLYNVYSWKASLNHSRIYPILQTFNVHLNNDIFILITLFLQFPITYYHSIIIYSISLINIATVSLIQSASEIHSTTLGACSVLKKQWKMCVQIWVLVGSFSSYGPQDHLT